MIDLNDQNLKNLDLWIKSGRMIEAYEARTRINLAEPI